MRSKCDFTGCKEFASFGGALFGPFVWCEAHYKGKIIVGNASAGKKDDSGKPPMDLLSHKALEEIANVFGYGAKKYGRYNYRSGIAYSRLIAAAYRHLGAFNSGENLDRETNLSHCAHLAACAIMLLDMVSDKPALDDRFKASGNCPEGSGK